jgi:hypothetical protein
VRTHFEKFGTRLIEKEISRWGDVIARAKLEKQ